MQALSVTMDPDGTLGVALRGELDFTNAGEVTDAIRAVVERERPAAVRMDLTERASLGAAVERVLAEWGRIDVLVNNAVHTGPGSMLRFDDTTIDMIETKLAANVVSQVVLIKAVLPHMLERGSGHLVHTASSAGTLGFAMLIPYCVTKFGVVGLCESLVNGRRSPVGARPEEECIR